MSVAKITAVMILLVCLVHLLFSVHTNNYVVNTHDKNNDVPVVISATFIERD